MAARLRSALARAGLRVDSDEFLALVEDAARQLSPVDPDPAEYFTEAQRAALSEVGLDLTPRQPSERDPRARTVALQAVLRVGEVLGGVGVDGSQPARGVLDQREELVGVHSQAGAGQRGPQRDGHALSIAPACAIVRDRFAA